MIVFLSWILIFLSTWREGQIAVSPSGDRMAWVSNRSGSWQIWMEDDGGVHQLTFDSLATGWPSFSADGTRLYYYSGRDASYTVWRIPVQGGAREQVTDGVDFRASESPDGRHLLFDRSLDGNHDLHIMDLSTGESAPVAPHPGYDSDGRWSPDGKHILFHSDRNGSMQVFSVELETGQVTPWSSGPDRHLYPSWCPDGRRISWVVETTDGQRRIEGFDLQDSRTVALAGPGTESPIWSPDGTVLYYSERSGPDVSRIARKESTFCTVP